MDLEAKLKFYEKLYFHELERRDAVERRLRLPFAMFAIVFGLAFFLLKQLHAYPTIEIGVFFYVIFSAATGSLALSVLFFILSWYSYAYRVLPNAVALDNYYNKTLDHYRGFKNGKASEWTKEAFNEYLLAKFQEYASYNAYKNDRKSFLLYVSANFLIASFVLVSASYYPLFRHFLAT